VPVAGALADASGAAVFFFLGGLKDAGFTGGAEACAAG
jgi:hypothetical protein